MSNKDITFTILDSSVSDVWLNDLAKLRMTVFREFPYLYDGEMASEKKHVSYYLNSKRAVLITAENNGVIIGASTAVHLADESADVRQPFIEKSIDVTMGFYFSESVILKEWRGIGIGRKFFEMREAEARRHGCAFATFCAVERPTSHPDRPADYQTLDTFWNHRGFQKREDLASYFSWRDLGNTIESQKKMVFWMKSLTP